MRSIVTMIVQLIVDESAPDRLCGRVETSLPFAAPGCTNRIYFKDEQQLIEILHSIVKPLNSNIEEEPNDS